MRLLVAAVPFLACCVGAQESLEYVGCYRDDTSRAMVQRHNLGGLATVRHCADTCAGYQYIGLQYAVECYCGNEYDTHGSADESDCNHACRGDPTVMCGGEWRLSVYSITGQSEGPATAACVSNQLAGLSPEERLALICDEMDEELDTTTCSADELAEIGVVREECGESAGVGAGIIVVLLMGFMCIVSFIVTVMISEKAACCSNDEQTKTVSFVVLGMLMCGVCMPVTFVVIL